jgi:hypothetical protein
MNAVFSRTHQICLTCVIALLSGCTRDAQKTETVSSQHDNAPIADIQIKDPKPYPFRFIAYGDMRFAERESYGRKVIANAEARQQVIDQIAKEAPAFLVITGDLVFRGFHAEDWTFFDRAIKPLRDSGMRIFPAIGSHEVGPFPPQRWGRKAFQEIEKKSEDYIASRGLDNYYKDFPEISHKPWYSIRYANCYFLILNSETDDEPSIAAQGLRIRTQLDAIPSDVDYVLVALHRPPYTALTDDVHKPRKMQIDLRILLEDRQKKMRAHIIVIAGHVHNYERYAANGVTYIVSGGGGAAQVKFPRDANDLYRKNDPLNEDQYHYCVFTVNHSKLNFQMMKLVGRGKSMAFEPRDSFELDIARH